MLCDFKLNKEFLDCCDKCHRAEQTRNSFSLSESKASNYFELIPRLYLVVIIFYALWMTLVVLPGFICLETSMRHVKRIVDFCCMVKTQFGTDVKRVRSDNRTEFTKGELQDYFFKRGMLNETSCVDMP